MNPKIVRETLTGEYIDEWRSLADIKEKLGFCKANIHNCLTGKTKYSHGYKWKKVNK